MNRKFITAFSIFLVGSATLFAQEEQDLSDYLLIDFAKLAPGYQPADGEIYQRQVDPAPLDDTSDSTVVTFANSGAALKPEAEAAMRESLAIDRWQINLSPSARWHNSIVDSYVLAYKMKDTASLYAGENVLAARIHFSPGDFNTHALISPPFLIPAYADPDENTAANDLSDGDPWGQFLHYGVLRNVGDIRTISAWVYGRNFPLDLKLILHHEYKGDLEIPLGRLDFLGWRKLTWVNPSYIQDVRKRTPVSNHVYPQSMPSLVFRGFRLTRQYTIAGNKEADAVFYAKSVYVIFDKSSEQDMTADIEDEKIWQINADRARTETVKRNRLMSRKLEDRYYQFQNRIPFPQNGDGSAPPAAAPATDPAQ